MTVNERYQVRLGDRLKYRYGRDKLKVGTVGEMMRWGVCFSPEATPDGGWITFNAGWSDIVSVNGRLVSSPSNSYK